MARNLDQNYEDHAARPSGASHSTPPGDDVPKAWMSADTAFQESAPDDLPDIIDVVMEMGRGPDNAASTEGTDPAPPLPAAVGANARLPGHLECQLVPPARC